MEIMKNLWKIGVKQYRKQHGILKQSFSYDMIPFDVMKDYAAMDAVVTFLLV